MWNDRFLRYMAMSLVGMVASALAGCGSQANPGPTAPPGTPLKITILSNEGPLGIGPPNLVAATSVAELEALLRATGSVRFRNPDGWNAFAGHSDRVFVAMTVGFCVHLASVTATRDSRSGIVLITEQIEGKCAPGAGAAAIPGVYLAEMPRGQLGSGVVTVRVNNGFGRARLDLRPPTINVEPMKVTTDAREAIAAARSQIQLTQPPVHELDRMRWPDDALACQPSADAPSALSIDGYIVVVATSTDVDPRPEEFHWTRGKLVDCGPAPGV